MTHLGSVLIRSLLIAGAILLSGRPGESEEPERQAVELGASEPPSARAKTTPEDWVARPWMLKAPAFAIADNLYYVGNQRFASHLVVGENGIVLIDTPYKEHAYLLTESIRSVGVDPADITLILHTHHHYDHVGTTRRIKELSGADVAMGARDVKRLKSLLSLEYTLDFWNVTAGYFEPFEVERPLKHGDTVDLGDTVIHCHHTPGHTPGTMSFTFDIGTDGQRHTAVLFGGPGLNFLKIKGAYYPGAKDDFAHSLDYLESLDASVFLGAHPFQNDTLGKYERLKKGEKPNPFIDREGFMRFLKIRRIGLEKLVAEKSAELEIIDGRK